jgi:beta-galactosidase
MKPEPHGTLGARRPFLLALSLAALLAACGGGGYGGGGGGSMGGGYSAPTILTQPANASVAAGQSATFTVVASGIGTVTYQWMKNSVDISGATMASYTTPPVTSADNNAQFAVKVTDAYGTTTSNHAILTVT